MKPLKKEITFIYKDAVEKQVYEMIAEEAEKRGYRTKLTDDPFTKCEIGWYCDHVNFPQFSRFSLIMLHDIVQQYGYWPDLWLRESWRKYDIGFLPSRIWEDNWNQSSQWYYANPRRGVYLTGWPKADRLAKYRNSDAKERFAAEIGLDPARPTVLYAPAWENDGKQDEFVQAMLPMKVNILVKQPPWAPSYADQIEEIRKMRELHQDNPRVHQLDPKVSILDAIMVSDILVSEESSTMSEAVMLGKPAIAVTDWLIPDVTPSRLPVADPEYTIQTPKAGLAACVREVLDHYDEYHRKAAAYTDTHFTNLGNCIPMMMDILDAAVEGRESPHPALAPQKRQRVPLKQLAAHFSFVATREILFNYCERIPPVKALYRVYTRIRYGKDAPGIGGIEG